MDALSYSFLRLGAMSWAFLESTKANPDPTYKEVCRSEYRCFASTDIV